MTEFKIGDRWVGADHPTYVIAELGLNHQGDVKIAKQLIDVAITAGADAVKLQKRHPETCVPKDQWDKMRQTPWGYISYIDYRKRIEFGPQEYNEIAAYCYKRIPWSVSVWDQPSLLEMTKQFPLPFIKIPSAKLTDEWLLKKARMLKTPIILSTGMSTNDEIREAVTYLHDEMADPPPLAILHCTSTYPCALEELNLSILTTWQRIPKLRRFVHGFSNHSPGIIPSVVAVALGASIIEAHVTLDRTMWGGDHAASIEPHGFAKMVKYIRDIEIALGDGVKKVYKSELPIIAKLRGT